MPVYPVQRLQKQVTVSFVPDELPEKRTAVTTERQEVQVVTAVKTV
jgi:hypothetical protein